MKILIANPGSTSYKCKLYDMQDMRILFQANVERIGEEESLYSYKFFSQREINKKGHIADYFAAVNGTIKTLKKEFAIDEISAVGFKTIHAKDITGCVELGIDVIDAMKSYLPLAPVHTQVYLNAITVFQKILPATPLIGLFETTFHTEIPAEAFLYGIPYEYYEKYGIRKYGFHGASHRYITQRARELYFKDQPSYKLISCHLGGSSSVCAIKDGKSVDTSMGMSPQCGLLNANRVGDLDPFALLYLMEMENMLIDQVRKILISKSGVLGISGSSGDFRDILKNMQRGDKRAELAFRTFVYNVKRYIGEYLAILNGADCIVFTAGSGQNSPQLREAVLADMDKLGIKIDKIKNYANPKEGIISADSSLVKVAVIPTNEELVVAQEVQRYLA